MPEATQESVHCVILFPIRAEEVAQRRDASYWTKLDTFDVPVSLLESQKPIPCTISAALGIPLKMAAWPAPQSKRFNPGAGWLFLEIDAEHPDFGKVRHRRIRGAVVLAREDGKDLEQQYVQALMAYVEGLRGEMSAFLELEAETTQEEKVVTAKEIVGRVLRKESFKKFLKEFKVTEVAKGAMGWERIDTDE